MIRFLSRLILCATLWSLLPACANNPAHVTGSVWFNNQLLGNGFRQGLEDYYNIRLPPGRYWYDASSGLWGPVGESVVDQIIPGLNIGDSLPANASNGNTGVFINDREIPLAELIRLGSRYSLKPGRYWMNADGVGGPEGGRAVFDFNLSLDFAGAQHPRRKALQQNLVLR